MFSFHTRIRSDQSKMPRTDIIVEWVTSGFVDDIVTEWADRVDRAGLTRPSQDFFNLIKTMDYIATHCLQSVNNNLNLTQYIIKYNTIISLSTLTLFPMIYCTKSAAVSPRSIAQPT